MSKNATLQVDLPPKLKNEVEDILARLGLTAAQTIQLFYQQIRLNQGLPFEVRLPNKVTANTLRASRSSKGVRHFGTKQELFADLGL